MKFTWFNLMPWPYLPDDFREQNRSVWVDIPSKLYDPKKGHFVYHQYMDQLEYAETLGFDGIGCNEHHQNGYGLMPSPNLIAAGLARRTSRAAICVIGNSIAGYNPPIRVAEEFAMLDVISGGRLVAGFPVGTPMDTNFCYGQIPALTRDGVAVLAYFVSDGSPNNFPALPVREGENVFVWFAGFGDRASYDALHGERSEIVNVARRAPGLAPTPQVLRLAPTSRSLLTASSQTSTASRQATVRANIL